MRLHLALGEATHVDRIEVRWIGGTDVFEDIDADQIVTLTEGGTSS
jgi:hypothetical protein